MILLGFLYNFCWISRQNILDFSTNCFGFLDKIFTRPLLPETKTKTKTKTTTKTKTKTKTKTLGPGSAGGP